MNDLDAIFYPFKAEFAPKDRLVVCWNVLYNDLPYRKIAEAAGADGTTLLIVCRNPEEGDYIRSILARYAISLDHIRFLIFEFDSIWVRDYAPLPIRTLPQVSGLVGYRYSKGENRQHDVRFAAGLQKELGMPLFPYDLVLSGGNFTTNGLGTVICTDQLSEENTGQKDRIHDCFEAHGASRLLVIRRLPHEYTGHVDMLMKFVAPDVLLVASLHPDMPDHAVMEDNLQYIRTQLPDCKIITLPVAPDKGSYQHLGNVFYSYINSVILKKTVLIPFYGEATDDLAMEVYQSLFPEHTLTGIYCKDLVQLKGALHCMTAQV